MKLHALSIPPMPIRNLCQEILGRRAAPGGIGCKQSAGVGKQSSRVVHAALPRER